MKKCFILLIVLSLPFLFSSCWEYRKVISVEAVSIANDLIANEMKENGYKLSGTFQESKNEMFVSATSYSRYAGYGNKMSNNIWQYSSFSFKDSFDNDVNYEIKYRVLYAPKYRVLYAPGTQYQYNQYIEYVEVTKCSATKDYNNICGANGIVRVPFNYLNSHPDTTIYAPIKY